ncbi:MAG TPA: GntR family transcriptional regulator [Thermomicrobiales bacterium]|nr:GntR family transcriptional regulator [Thermomicrobiales bacterium]
MNTSDASPLPLYARIEADLRARLEAREWNPGDQLPPEAELMDHYQVSRITIRKAIDNLARQNLITIRRGKGTFASAPPLLHDLSRLTGFVEMTTAGKRNATSRLIDHSVIVPDQRISTALNQAPGSTVTSIRRLRLADGMPVSLDQTFLPHDIGARLQTADLEQIPLLALLEDHLGIPLIEAQYGIEATGADADAASHLAVTTGFPVMKVERSIFTTTNRPITYELLTYRGDMVRFQTRLSRKRT